MAFTRTAVWNRSRASLLAIARAVPSTFDIRKGWKKPFARVSLRTTSLKRSLIAVRLKRRLYNTRWGSLTLFGYVLRATVSSKTAG